LTTWSYSYFSLEQRHRFVELLERASQARPVAWLSADGAGIVEALAPGPVTAEDRKGGDVLGAVLFDRGRARSEVLAYIQSHGNWIDWRAPPD
jgi:hypothetical protein